MQWSELALFARDFLGTLAPLRQALEQAAGRVAASKNELPAGSEGLAAGLAGLAEELAGLAQRVASERSSVFVFGPAKAGKSTLLDALAGVRVSEASILPGYSCVRRVRPAAALQATLLRFDGTTQVFEDAGALRLHLQRAHGELVARVREARAGGEAFDAVRHCLAAVRRVEGTLPAPALESGALELVECPPIHGPLFPSYGEMMIGEPDHARAGVFVVRAGQLADDAVFDGIEELLEAFERLILVVNLDQRARELSLAGELAPGPECEDPARLVAAFEELSTCAPLAQALTSGRVPVLALDLLGAAHARLHGAEEEPGPAGRPHTRFADLTREVSAVLDSHEVFRALAASATRRASELCAEVRELTEAPGLDGLGRTREAVTRERAALVATNQALERLGARTRDQWQAEELFDALRTRLCTEATTQGTRLAYEVEKPLARAIEDWFTDGTSLQTLLEQALAPRLSGARDDLARAAERLLREECLRGGTAGGLAAATRGEFEVGQLDFGALLARCVERLGANLDPLPLRPLDVAAIPVRPKVGERFLLRGANEVRRALFGPSEAPERELTSAEKARRLGAEARAVMQRSTIERALTILAEEALRIARALDDALLTKFVAALQQEVSAGCKRLEAPMATLRARSVALQALEGSMTSLESCSARAQKGLSELAERIPPPGTLVPAARVPRENEGGSEMPAQSVEHEHELARE